LIAMRSRGTAKNSPATRTISPKRRRAISCGMSSGASHSWTRSHPSYTSIAAEYSGRQAS